MYADVVGADGCMPRDVPHLQQSFTAGLYGDLLRSHATLLSVLLVLLPCKIMTQLTTSCHSR